MLQPQTFVSFSRVEDTNDGNPWLQNNDDPFSAKDHETEGTIHCTCEGPPMGSHKRSYTTGHPLCTSNSDDGEDLTGEVAQSVSLDTPESVRSYRRSSKRANGRACSEGASQMEEKEVIVHEVKPTDSLAGVALKYNVTLATIRAANKLWASDSIHLRRVLYIPIEAVFSKQLQFPIPPFHPSPAPQELRKLANSSAIQKGTPGEGVDWEAIRDEASNSYARSPLDVATIRRVPISELSFFPPSTNGDGASNTMSLLSPISREVVPAAIISSQPRNPLATLFNEAREEIMHRLSFDSARETSEPGEDEAHELEEVRKENRSRTYSFGTDRPLRRSEFLGLTDDPLGLPTTPKIVRTIQPQPSPNMIIPQSPTRIRKT